MVQRRVFALSAFVSIGLLSACAAPSQSVITRAWQVDGTLAGIDRGCRFDAISRTAKDEISVRDDADQIFEKLWNACPELELVASGGVETEDRPGTDRSVRVASAANAGGAGAGAGPETTADRASDTAGSTGDTGSTGTGDAGRSAGGDTSGGSGGTSGTDGSAASSGSSSNGSDGLGETSGDKGGKGSRANNGDGNGSEGSSPGRGKGANQDE